MAVSGAQERQWWGDVQGTWRSGWPGCPGPTRTSGQRAQDRGRHDLKPAPSCTTLQPSYTFIFQNYCLSRTIMIFPSERLTAWQILCSCSLHRSERGPVFLTIFPPGTCSNSVNLSSPEGAPVKYYNTASSDGFRLFPTVWGGKSEVLKQAAGQFVSG